MVWEFGFARDHGFESSLHNLHVYFPHLFLLSSFAILWYPSPPIYNFMVFVSLHVREGIKRAWYAILICNAMVFFGLSICNSMVFVRYEFCLSVHVRVWGHMWMRVLKKYDMHIEFKSYKFKLLGKLAMVFVGYKFCQSFHVRVWDHTWGRVLKEHDMYIEPKLCKLKLLGKLINISNIYFKEKYWSHACYASVNQPSTPTHVSISGFHVTYTLTKFFFHILVNMSTSILHMLCERINYPLSLIRLSL